MDIRPEPAAPNELTVVLFLGGMIGRQKSENIHSDGVQEIFRIN